MSFLDSIATCMRKYATFSGRASPSEFWWFFLFYWGVQFIAFETNISTLAFIVLVIPFFAAMCRRMHDVNKRGWCWLLCFTIIGCIPIIYWLSQSGDEGENRFGPSPTTEEITPTASEPKVTEPANKESTTTDVRTQRLREIGELRDQGVLTEEEFLLEKRKILD